MQLVVGGVELLGPVEPDDADRAVGLDLDLGREVVRRTVMTLGSPRMRRGDEVALDLRGAAHDALGPAVEVDLQPGVVAAAVAGAADRQRGVADGLLDLGHEQLVDRALGTVVDAVEAVGQPAAHVEAQHLGLDDRPAEVADLLGAVALGVGAAPGR